jgi:hypothetical protein
VRHPASPAAPEACVIQGKCACQPTNCNAAAIWLPGEAGGCVQFVNLHARPLSALKYEQAAAGCC